MNECVWMLHTVQHKVSSFTGPSSKGQEFILSMGNRYSIVLAVISNPCTCPSSQGRFEIYYRLCGLYSYLSTVRWLVTSKRPSTELRSQKRRETSAPLASL